MLATSSIQLTIAQAADSNVSIQAANAAVNQAYTNVRTLENEGENVSSLISRLNTAGDLLAQAENTYNSGDTADVASKANNAALIAAQVNSDATAQLSRANTTQSSFITTISFSIIGIVVSIIILSLVWRRLKRSHYRNLLSLKPEVIENPA